MIDTELACEGVRVLARELFRLCFLKLMICQSACQPDEISSLKLWEELYFAECGVSSHTSSRRTQPAIHYPITRRILAYQQAKERARNPVDIRALLVYEISHGSEEVTEKEDMPGDSCRGHACKKCGDPIDSNRRQRLLEHIEKGYRLWKLRSLRAADEIVGTHLTREEVFRFTGYEVNFDRLRREVIDPLYNQLESEVRNRWL